MSTLPELPERTHINDATPVPFRKFEVTRWRYSDGTYFELESHADGSYAFHGRIGGVAFDDDGEDFCFADSDALLDFLEEHGLLSVLAAPTASPQT